MRARPDVLILALLAAFLLSVGFGGCQERADGKDPVQVKKDSQVAQVAANLKPIGQSLEASGRPAEGAAVRSQAQILDNIVDVPLGERPAPIATYEEWMAVKESKASAERLAARFQQDAAAKTAELDEIKAANGSWWAWLKDGSAIAGTLAAAAAVYRGLNGPGSQLVDLGVKVLFPKGFQALQGHVNQLAEKNDVLVTAVAGSDVAREALADLDARMAKLPKEAQDALAGLIGAATGGRADSLQDFFKTFAKAHAVDEGLGAEVGEALSEIRNTAPTKGGRSEAFLGIAQALVAAAGHRA